MPPIRRLSLFSAGLLAAFALLPSSGRAASPAARVVSESATGLTLRISFPEPVRTEVEENGARFLSIQIPGLISGSEAAVGSPDLPSRGFPFGLPEGSSARIVRSTLLSTVAFQGLPPVPVPERSIVPGDPLPSQVFRYVANPEVYASARSVPEDRVSLGPVFGLRHQRVQSLIVRPVTVVPSAGAYEAVRELEVELRFESDPGAPPSGRRESVRTDAPGWEETYNRLLVNPASSRSFRTRQAPAALEPAIDPSDTYVRIRLGGSGLCRIPYADLAAEGWPAGIAVGDVRVEERGFNKQLADPFTVVSLPRQVEDTNQNGIFDAGDYVIFHGLNYRDRFNPPTITDARYSYFHTYWVTASGGPGSDMVVVEGFPADTGYVAVTSFLQSEHFEQNLTYINNPKDSLPYIYPIYDALYWLLSNQKVVDLPFNIGDLAQGGVFRVRARWQGVNTALATRTHVVALDLNQQELLPESQATTFCDLEPFLWEGTFQPMAGMLSAGQNTLTVRAHASDNPSGCAYGQSQNQFSGALFDWFDVIYERVLVARNDQLTFNSGSAIGRIELAVSGFTSPDVLVLDITDPVGAFVLTPNIESQGATYTARIRVTVGATQRKFIAIVPDAVSGLPHSAYLLPTDLGTKAIARGLPRDLLTEGEGSDYILITHPNFVDAWQPLVLHRENLGHQVFVCDVWEIYDQFAGGDKTPWAIQRFLQQAFRNWDPSPSFVLLGADANEDYRGDTPESNPDWVPTQMHFGAVPGTSGPELAGTDAWYVQFLRQGDPEYDVLPEMNYGRIPAGSVTEVTDFVQKVLNYEAMSPTDDWRRRGFFLADDQYSSGILSGAAYCWQSGEQTFRTTTLAVVDSIKTLAGLQNFRSDVVLLSAYLDSVPNLNRDPGPGDCPGASVLAATTNYTRSRVTPGVIDSLSHGYVIWEFTGHANRSRMTHEVLLDHSSITLHDMDKVLNFGKPFLFMGYACHLMEYEYVKEAAGPQDNIGEALLMASNRGAIGVFASSSYEWLPTNPLAQLYTTRPLFWNLPRDPNGRPRRLW
ncbi:MAG TPA: C25 family cysteine peptidase, partial [Candidatus Eisenbacteria bacterium]|nr:C25 family cysteine peptidase [Candidatus Eisenbacteria bacterium]